MANNGTRTLADVERHLDHFSDAEPAVLAAHLHTDHGVTKPTPWKCLVHALAHLVGAL